jgi:hypothetical protein
MTPMRTLAAALLAAALLFTAIPASAQTFYGDEIRETEAVLRKNPSSLNNHLRLATLHYLAGVAWGESGYTDRALFSANNAVLILSNAGIPVSNPVYQEALYASAYYKWEGGDFYDALLDLDIMLGAAPSNYKALYLKGAVLMDTPAKGSWARSLKTFSEAGTAGDEGQAMVAGYAANRVAYNVSTAEHALGMAEEALGTLSAPAYDFGVASAASPAENDAAVYAEGAYTYSATGPLGGMTVWEDLYETSPNFKLANGLSLKTILSDAYYASALELLAQKSPNTASWALTLLDKAGALGNDADVNLHHARAVAYKILGDQAKVVESMNIVKILDAERFAAINTAK